MADQEWVDGDGWISDESDFYGSDKTRRKLNALVGGPAPKRPWRRPVPRRKKQRIEEKGEDDDQEASTSDPTSTVNGANDQVESPDHITSDIQENSSSLIKTDPAAWQQSDESIDAFLKRLPVRDRATAKVGPWLWVYNPNADTHTSAHSPKSQIQSFIAEASTLLRDLSTHKLRLEQENTSKAPGTITRLTRPKLLQTEEAILRLAKAKNVTSGKWMLFPYSDDVERYWRAVAQATAQGLLGPTAKVATTPSPPSVATGSTRNPSPDDKQTTLICVYTSDFTDMADIRRVLQQLVALDLVASASSAKDTASGRAAIYYKCDAYTYLDIGSKNEHKIRASLYSSRDLLAANDGIGGDRGGRTKALEESAVARMLRGS